MDRLIIIERYIRSAKKIVILLPDIIKPKYGYSIQHRIIHT